MIAGPRVDIVDALVVHQFPQSARRDHHVARCRSNGGVWQRCVFVYIRLNRSSVATMRGVTLGLVWETSNLTRPFHCEHELTINISVEVFVSELSSHK